jgi:hypothetical protein
LADLAFQEIAGDPDEADDDIGGNGRIGMLDAFPECIISGIGNPAEIPQSPSVRVVFVPFLQAACPEEIALIGQQFLEAGARDIGQLDLHFL